MGKPFIAVGDRTSHGGTVVGGAPAVTTGGRPVARVGDVVTCPVAGHGTNVIASGDPMLIVMGRPVARDGDVTACGATLIAGQHATVDGS
ncbi:MAG TPA: PAAR domain-containing protein [Nevskiaceae bacterium]